MEGQQNKGVNFKFLVGTVFGLIVAAIFDDYPKNPLVFFALVGLFLLINWLLNKRGANYEK